MAEQDGPAIVEAARRLQAEAADLCQRAASAVTAADAQRERARIARARRRFTAS
ncbi:hypothetical protein [Paractinoplanes lichenicola]|uniref:Uncharacterized protein n=1 Tax=Paractinoplanes lichenicola TaxID=2802976 RepID=A0ABS1VDT8_9ACTN|nr:hypothetical protein [Actinoplanes lichenicola]MBL7252842.1 hypothetical protein [Actinoplanes lichenicola]